MEVFDTYKCILGEGAFWHPKLNQFFWFDIEGKKLFTKSNHKTKIWPFKEMPSACSWIDNEHLLIAFESSLSTFNIVTEKIELIVNLEKDNNFTRSNDGRADPWGGFWIGTMGKKLEKGLGKIYRFFKGEIHELYSKVSIPNSICFSPGKEFAYYTDTSSQKIMRVNLDKEGWPKGEAKIFVDLTIENLNPDGSVVDSSGCLWNAQWGAGRVAKYSSEGKFINSINLPAFQTTCPAFGGADCNYLFVTSALIDITHPRDTDGQTFVGKLDIIGQKEYKVTL